MITTEQIDAFEALVFHMDADEWIAASRKLADHDGVEFRGLEIPGHGIVIFEDDGEDVPTFSDGPFDSWDDAAQDLDFVLEQLDEPEPEPEPDWAPDPRWRQMQYGRTMNRNPQDTRHGDEPPFGYVDSLGYLRCVECAKTVGMDEEPVYSPPHSEEPCEICDRPLNTIPLTETREFLANEFKAGYAEDEQEHRKDWI